MYLAMDEFGRDYYAELLELTDPGLKWTRITEIAGGYSFSGIQLNSKVYEEVLGLDLLQIPWGIMNFRLSYHVGGVFPLVTSADIDGLHCRIKRSLEVSTKNGVEDVSFHPPLDADSGSRCNDTALNNLRSILETWLPRFQSAGVTLSMESHVSKPVFVLHSLKDFHDFVSNYPELGVLIDFSHNCFDGYSVPEIIESLDGLKITGLHLSDAQPGWDFRNGTHLPIGRGVIDFAQVVRHFQGQDIYAALEVKGTNQDISSSVGALKNLHVASPVDCAWKPEVEYD